MLRFSSLGFCQFGPWARTRHHSSGHVEVASHIASPEGVTTKIYNYVLRGFREKKKKKKNTGNRCWLRGQSLKKFKKKKKNPNNPFLNDFLELLCGNAKWATLETCFLTTQFLKNRETQTFSKPLPKQLQMAGGSRLAGGVDLVLRFTGNSVLNKRQHQ